MNIYAAGLNDAKRIGHFMVETWLEAHRSQIPDEQWHRRRLEWTPEVSAAGWENTLGEMAAGTRVRTCIYLAGTREGGRIDGLVMGAPARRGPWEDAAEIRALYVQRERRGEGLGRQLLRAAVADLIAHDFDRLIIGCLDTNTPARRFYEHLGGVIMGHVEEEEYGFINIEVLYGWETIESLTA